MTRSHRITSALMLWPISSPKEPRTLSIAKRSATCTHSGRNGPTLGSTAMSFTGRGCQTVFRLKHFLRRHLRIAYRSGAELKMREAVEKPARSDEATLPLREPPADQDGAVRAPERSPSDVAADATKSDPQRLQQ